VRVVQINSVCGVGSTGRLAVDIQHGLEARGHQGYVVYGRGPASRSDWHISIEDRLGTYGHMALTRLLDRHGFGSARATRRLINELEKLDPDVIHLHNVHGYYVNVQMLFDYLRTVKKPIVWTLHDCWAFTGHCAYFDYAGCDRWKVACYACPEKRAYPSSVLMDNSSYNYKWKKRLFSGLDRLVIVTPSKWLGELVGESFLGQYPLAVINNGVDTERFRPVESTFRALHGIENRFVVLGVASVWSRRKGLEYLVRLAASLGNDAVIVIVGMTGKRKDAIPDRVISVNRTDSVDELVDIYSAADVFVNPTLEDNFPTTILEAMACGTPVVTFDSGGSAESVDKGCGIVVRRGDFEGLLSAVNTIKKKGKQAYSEYCVNRVKRCFDRELMVSRYMDLYGSVL